MGKLTFKVKAEPMKGRIVYEYNPFYNFRLKDGLKDEAGNTIVEPMAPTDFDTTNEFLNFDLNHPVDITCQNSYDGSVNLILNDNKNIPRLINSRFSVRENNTYEVVDREGSNDTNLYDDYLFDNDTSLYKRVVKAPIIELHGVNNSGHLSVGNYVFYVKYVDADENETDIAAESGLVSCFVGTNATPKQINGGYMDLDSYKAVTLKLTNLDKQYDYIRVYYTRSSSDVDLGVYTRVTRVLQKYPITTTVGYITITGTEESENIDLSALNLKYFIATTAKTLAQCLNRLYFGNVRQSCPEHKKLKDLSLRIYPEYTSTEASALIGSLNGQYIDYTTKALYKYLYYNVHNIYNYVGYWPEEFYRFGIVYIMKDGTLSPVYNILGVNELKDEAFSNGGLKFYDIEMSKDKLGGGKEANNIFNNLEETIEIDETTFRINNTSLNAKGVVKFPDFSTEVTNSKVLGIKFTITPTVYKAIQQYAQGFFFVRLRRIPTILCLGMTMDLDLEANIPLLKGGVAETFLNKTTRKLTNEYTTRLLTTDLIDPNASACICPDYEVHPSLYNQLFTGSLFTIKVIGTVEESVPGNPRLRDETLVNPIDPYYLSGIGIAAVLDSSPVVIVDNAKFRGMLGEALDASKFRYLGHEDKLTKATNLVRGVFGPYLGFTKKVDPYKLINIYIPDHSSARYEQYRKERFEDNSEYMAISNRYSLTDDEFSEVLYRGDCYLCNSTHRLNRNFLDPGSPTNDIIIDPSTWKGHYKYSDADSCSKVNTGDLNAVKLGTWLTLSVRSSRNIGLRALDLSYPSEQGMFGHPRGFYPLLSISADGDSKMPDSQVVNGGYLSSLGHRWNYTLPYMPAIKNTFQTRIAYSDIAIGDAFKNGYRVFPATNYRDYTMNYGAITKLVEFNSNLVCVFEHGVALIPVNERTVAGLSDGGSVFINTSNVLPENPRILSDLYGSQWPESVIKTSIYVYGIDTIGKKIWRTNGAVFECLSDMTMLHFLNDNISLGEFEMTPIIGLRNVKTHYNAFKLDVMFTFYDFTKGLNEVSWNLCFNEFNLKFVTFYSWIPSFSDNIHNVYFSFDRDTSKLYAKLAASLTGTPEASGITVRSCNVSDWAALSDLYFTKETELSLSNISIPEYTSQIEYTSGGTNQYKPRVYYTYLLLKDPWNNRDLFTIQGDKLKLRRNLSTGTDEVLPEKEFLLFVRCIVKIRQDNNPENDIAYGTYESTIYLYKTESSIQSRTNWFWKHGLAGIFDNAEKIRPTFWYGRLHPFEFEVIVADKPSMHKIFNNLRIMSNKAAPESFHYEVVGEVYDWAWDKPNMYYRLEATKCLYQLLGSDIVYNWKYMEDSDYEPVQEASYEAIKVTNGVTLYNEDNTPATQTIYKKSTLFPATYVRLDQLEEIKDSYVFARDVYSSWVTSTISRETDHDYDYMHLSGSEIVYDHLLNEYRVATHSPAMDLKKVGRLKGNMMYKEDMWDIQISPTIFLLKNEPAWVNDVPPIAVVGQLPSDITTKVETTEDLSTIVTYNGRVINNDLFTGTDISKYDINCFSPGGWGNRKETKPRDKYLRVRVRYSGKDLAVINSLITLYTVSYA